MILLGSVPARMFDPILSVSGRTVLSLKVIHGTPSMQVSSWIPPESVKTSLAWDSNGLDSAHGNGGIDDHQTRGE